MGACINEALTGMLRAAVTDVVNPALEMLSDTLLQTPLPSRIPRLTQLWESSWQLATAFYGIVILVGAVIVMSHQTIQTHYGVREIGPRLVVGFLAAWLTLPLADMAVQIANAVSDALLGPMTDPAGRVGDQAGMGALAAYVQASITGPGTTGLGAAWLVLLFGLVIGVALVAVLSGYILRVVATIVLIAAAPLLVMWHGLPQTDPVARWWWRALGGVLSIQIIQALVLAIAVQILLPPPSPDGQAGESGQVLGLGGSGWVTLLVLGALLWVLIKIPGWVWSMIRFNGGGRSLLGTAVRAAILWKTGGLLRGVLGGKSGRTRSRGAKATREATDAGPDDSAPEFSGGQLGIPFQGLRRRRPKPNRSRGFADIWSDPPFVDRPLSRAAERAKYAGQTELPLGDEWSENRAVLDKDEQWRLPLSADRVRKPPPAGRGFAEHDAPQNAHWWEPGVRGGRQLQFPKPWEPWHDQQEVLGHDGQYRLPIEPAHVERPTHPRGGFTPLAPTDTNRRLGRRQLEFPDRGQPFIDEIPVLDKDGQYRLPMRVTRGRLKSTPPPGAAPPATRPVPAPPVPNAASRWGTQVDPFRGNGPLSGGQYPVPLPHPPGTTTPTPPRKRTAARRARGVQTQLPIPIPKPPAAAQPPPAQSPPDQPPPPRPTPQPTPQPPSQPKPSQPKPRRSRPRRPGQEKTP